MEAAQCLYDAVKEAVVEVRRNGAEGNDLISRLIRATYEGRSLDDHEITTFVRSCCRRPVRPPRVPSAR
jgi:cytochrome P450